VRNRAPRLAFVIAATVIEVALVLPAIASAGVSEQAVLYSHDPVTIPNGHGAAKMTFTMDPTERTLGSVDANFRVRHARTQQLRLILKAPNGERVLLSDGDTHGENLGERRCTDDYNTRATPGSETR
jgi:hypothetical protein